MQHAHPLLPHRQRGVSALGVVAILALVYLAAWPVPIDPEAWEPPEAPALAGPFAPNSYLAMFVDAD